MKTTLHKFIKAGLVGAALFSLALTASASSTWTPAPAGTPPSCPAGAPGCDAPINVGHTAQTKSGLFEVDGGFISGTVSNLLSHVTIGMAPCPTCTTSAGGSAAFAPSTTSFASAGAPSILASAIGSVSNAFSGLFKPQTAYASLSTTCGVCYLWNTYNACEPVDAGSACTLSGGGSGSCYPSDTGAMLCTPPTTGGSGTGGTIGSSTTISGTLVMITAPAITFSASPATIGTGSSAALSWSVTNASSCAVTSSNGSNDWNSAVSVNATTHTATGTHSLGSFTTAGSFTYSMTCSSPSTGTATVTANVTVGPTYLLDVYGNASIHGYMNIASSLNAASLKQGGVAVCLQNGLNCPSASSTGNVTASSGTAGTLSKFSSASGITNSIVSDTGTAINVAGGVSMTKGMVVNSLNTDATSGPLDTGIRFGGPTSGEGISSFRTGTAGLHALDFYTNGSLQTSIESDGTLITHGETPLYEVDSTSCNAVSMQSSTTASDPSGVHGVKYFGSYTFPLGAATKYRYCYISGSFVHNTTLGELLPATGLE